MMNKIMLAAAAAALVIPSASMANHPLGSGPGGIVNQQNPDGFKNKGQCQSALSQEINRQRKDPSERSAARQGDSTSEFQLAMLDRFECRDDDGPFRVYLTN